jgi:pimeloyl-ACP methyl ester carboxylesterase
MARAGVFGSGVGVLAAGAAVGSVLGSVVERRLLRSAIADAQEHGVGYGTVHSPPVVVAADDGVQLYVEVDEAAPRSPYPDLTVVFSHGYALNLDSWHHQRLALREVGVRAVYWDQRAHGRSGRGERGVVSIDRLGADLASVLEATVPRGQPVVLVGHSMGGMTVLALADRRPELFGTRVVGVALVSTSAGNLSKVTYGVPAAAARLGQRFAPGVVAALGRSPRLVELSRRTGTDLEYAVTRLYSFGSTVPPAAVDFVRQMNAGTPIDVIADFFPAFADHNTFAALPVLERVATLVLVGDDDKLTPADHSRAIAADVPGAELVVVEDAGHMVMIEKPGIVDERLLALVERSARGTGEPAP